MSNCRSTRQSRNRHGAYVFGLFGCLLGACNQPEGGPKTETSQKTDLPQLRDLDPLDPMGMKRRDAAIREAAEAITSLANQLRKDTNFASLNKTLLGLDQAVMAMNDRIRAYPDELRQDLKSELAKADLEKLSTQAMTLLKESTIKVQALRIPDTEATLKRLDQTIANLNRRIEELDITTANRVLSQSADLQPKIDKLLTDSLGLVADVRDRLQSLPLKETTAGVQTAAAAVPELRADLQPTIWLANGLIVLLMVTSLIWIVQSFRGRRGPTTTPRRPIAARSASVDANLGAPASGQRHPSLHQQGQRPR